MTQVAIVTGSARGLGEAIARRLYADGNKVALAGIDIAGAERVAGELGDRALGVRHDIRELESWERLLGVVCEQFGDVQALVNNAARTEIRSFWDIAPDEWAMSLRPTSRARISAAESSAPIFEIEAPDGSSTSRASPARRATASRACTTQRRRLGSSL